MAATQPIPRDIVRRVERLERERWRSEVATGALGGGAAALTMSGDSLAETLAGMAARLEALEARVIELEGGNSNG